MRLRAPKTGDEFMDKATSRRALAQAGVKGSGQALAREDEDGTRERILRTAERLFAERGFNGVSLPPRK